MDGLTQKIMEDLIKPDLIVVDGGEIQVGAVLEVLTELNLSIPVIGLKKEYDKLNKLLANNTDQPLEKITVDTERDYYMDSEEAKKYGLIDKII